MKTRKAWKYFMPRWFWEMSKLVMMRALALLLSVLTSVPPVALAQIFGGGDVSQQQGGKGTGGGGGSPLGLPGQLGQMGGQAGGAQMGAVVTNPTALQNLTPFQMPCPRPQQFLYADFLAPTLNEIWPTMPEAILPTTLEQRMKQEQEAREEKHDKEQHEKEKQEREQEMRQQTELLGVSRPPIAQPVPPGAMPQGGVFKKQMPGEMQMLGEGQAPVMLQAQREVSKDYDIEEAFARFSILQGVKARLKQFGYDFFDAQASTFAPLTDVPVGPDYVIGPQDTLAIHIWNVPDHNLNRSVIAPVDRDGMLVIPQVGAIPVGGLTFSQAERVIFDRLKSLMKRFEVHVSMARLRTIKVFVVGEVGRPGSYELSALASASNAVYAACGATKSGSLRQIRVMRDGKLLSELDLYELFVSGDRSRDRRLQAGDVVVVPPIISSAAISGAVRRSAIYEIKPETHLSDLLLLAGGLTPIADRQRCHVFRLDPSRGRIILDVDLGSLTRAMGSGISRSPNSTNDPLIHDGDFIRIASLPSQVSNVVSLVGAIKSPGPYEYRPGMKLHDLLSPDQLTIDAYADQAELIRTDPVTFQSRVIVFSPKALFEGSQTEDHPLQRLDQVVLSTQRRSPNLVFVEGEVKRPGYLTIELGERLSSVLKRVGGFTPNAFPRGIVLVRKSVKQKQAHALERYVSSERQRLIAQSASAAAGVTGIAGAAALTGGGSMAEQSVLQLRLQQLESIIARIEPGRVVVRIDSLENLEGSEDDLQLEGHDRITVPAPPRTISVIGAVKNPTTMLYRLGWGLMDYIKQAGNMTEDANASEIYVVRANGSTESGYMKIKAIEIGDTIVVPQTIEVKTPVIALWSSIASIVSSAMLGVAAIAVIGR